MSGISTITKPEKHAKDSESNAAIAIDSMAVKDIDPDGTQSQLAG
jgi:hypothetical protein